MRFAIADFSYVEQYNRYDAQYFDKKYSFLDRLDEVNSEAIEKLAYVSDGNHLTIAGDYLEEGGVRYLRGQDVSTSMVIEDRTAVYIPEENFQRLKRSHIFAYDILVTIVGANTGCIGLVYNPPEKLTANCKLGIVRANENKLAPYIYAFLTSCYGQSQIERSIRGAGQTGLILPDLRALKVPVFSSHLMEQVSSVVLHAHYIKDEVHTIYRQAQQALLSELGLVDWQPKHTLSYVRQYSEVDEAKRIDAEHFQPKYEDIITAIKDYKGGCMPLGKAGKLRDKNYTPEDEKQYRYIELSNITQNGEVSGCTEALGHELPSRARRVVKTNDVIVSTIEGSLEKVALIGREHDGALCSTGFFVYQPQALNPETFLVFAKSIAGQLLLKQGCRGTILTAINKHDFGAIPLPLIDQSVQDKIKSLISEMYESKNKSNRLLDIAKQGIETAIEDNEATAEQWMKDEITSLGLNPNDLKA